MFFALSNGPVKLSRWRLQSLIACERMASDLEEQERKLHGELPAHLAEVLEGKRLVLFENLVRQYDYPDMEVVNFMKCGVDVVGEHSVSAIFPQHMVKPTTTPQLLLETPNHGFVSHSWG